MVGQSDRDVVVVDPPITVGKDPDLAEPGLSLGGDGRINLLWTIPWSFIDCEGNPIAGPRNDAPENHVSVVARTGVPMMVDTRVGYNVHCFITYDSLIEKLSEGHDLEYYPNIIVMTDKFMISSKNFSPDDSIAEIAKGTIRAIESRVTDPDGYIDSVIEGVRQQVQGVTELMDAIHDNYRLVIVKSRWPIDIKPSRVQEAEYEVNHVINSVQHPRVVVMGEFSFYPIFEPETPGITCDCVKTSCKFGLDYLVSR